MSIPINWPGESGWRLFEQNPVPVVVLERGSLRFLSANAATARWLGLSREALLERSLPGLLVAGSRLQLDHVSSATPLRLSLVRPGQQPVWADAHLQPIVFEGREALLATLVDVSAHVKEVDELRSSREFFQALINALPEGLLVQSGDGKVACHNTRLLHVLGLQEELVGRHASEVTARLRQLLADPSADETALELRLRDGRTLERHLEPVWCEDGNTFGLLQLFRDVTDRQRLEEAVRTGESRLVALLAGTGDVAIEFDVEGRCLNVWTNDQVMLAEIRTHLDRPPAEVLCPERGLLFLDKLDRVLSSGTPQVVDHTVVVGSRIRYLSGELSRVPALEGQLPTLLWIARDVTEHRKLQQRLALADRMISVGTLAAGVAHELNNPLAFILANLEYIALDLARFARGETHPSMSMADLQDALGDARQGVMRLRQIVRDLKTFSQADEERREPVHVHAVVESCINIAWNEIRHRARLVKEFEPVDPVVANEGRLAQVFLNLLINAAQAIREGAAEQNEIRISIRRGPKGGVMVAIKDTGSGIDPDVLPRIFDPFFTTKPVGTGTGLGLSICHNIINQLGGHIFVESKPGLGTTFRVELPGTAIRSIPRAEPTGSSQLPFRVRLLIVDDDARVGFSLRRLLADTCQVESVTRAVDALDRIRAGAAYDLILCDLMMPDVTGFDLFRELQQSAPEVARRMIFITGGAFTREAEEFFKDQARWRLEKPFSLEQVEGVISEALAQLGPAPWPGA